VNPQRLEQEVQLDAVQEEQSLADEAWTEPSELPKLHAEISLFTFGFEQSGQTISWPGRITNFSNFRSHSLQKYS